MIKRIFFAVNLPLEAKEALGSIREELRGAFDERAVKWVREDNLHVTLLFLGAVREEKIEHLQREIEKIKMEKFPISLDKVTYNSPDKRDAKIIWAQGKSRGLSELKEKIEKRLMDSLFFNRLSDTRQFFPHVTLGRIRKWEFKKMSLSGIPEINEDVEINFSVKSFVLLESKLKKEGPEYKLIKEFKLHE